MIAPGVPPIFRIFIRSVLDENAEIDKEKSKNKADVSHDSAIV